ncbi:MAG TPA: carbamoyl phosphate synthase large subunit, partial [Kofleriaceae bacterium]|nr:carbamoyl phosphate synthase large subunit [Kofleriaceae bacterium]
ELGVSERSPRHVSVKESVFPFVKFEGVDPILGPEMRSTGEVMGIDTSFAQAFAKAQLAAGTDLPDGGQAFLSLRDPDKPAGADIARLLLDLGFTLIATNGTADYLREHGLEVRAVNKVLEGHPHCVDAIENGDVDLVVNTTEGVQAIIDSKSIRRSALQCRVAYFTTVRGAHAAIAAISARREHKLRINALQAYHR